MLILIWVMNVLMLRHFFDISDKLALFIFLAGFMLWAKYRKQKFINTTPYLMFVVMLVWLFTIQPSNNRDWLDEVAELPRINIDNNMVTIENFRDFTWQSIDNSDQNWVTRDYDLNKLQGLSLIVVPFHDSKYMAHTMLVFEFENMNNIIVSVETRKEKNENYSLVAGALRQLELIYVFGSEQDLLTLRAVHRGSKLHFYPIKAEPEFIISLFKDLAQSANILHTSPQFYRTLRDNCTTTLVRHIDHHYQNKIGWRMQTVFPAKAGELLYELNRMDTHLSYQQAYQASQIGHLIKQFEEEKKFSALLHAEVDRAYEKK